MVGGGDLTVLPASRGGSGGRVEWSGWGDLIQRFRALRRAAQLLESGRQSLSMLGVLFVVEIVDHRVELRRHVVPHIFAQRLVI